MTENISNKHDTDTYKFEINRYNRSKKIIQIKITFMLLYIFHPDESCNPIYQCMSVDNQI